MWSGTNRNEGGQTQILLHIRSFQRFIKRSDTGYFTCTRKRMESFLNIHVWPVSKFITITLLEYKLQQVYKNPKIKSRDWEHYNWDAVLLLMSQNLQTSTREPPDPLQCWFVDKMFWTQINPSRTPFGQWMKRTIKTTLVKTAGTRKRSSTYSG